MNEEIKTIKGPDIEAVLPPPAKRRPAWLPVLILVTVFAVGFIPMWLKASRLNSDLARAERVARVQQIQITLADAALDARRGDYEPARQRTASFFTLLNAELGSGLDAALPAGASEGLKPLLAQRDDLITLLARSDQAAAERLATAYAEFRKTLGK